MSRSEVAARQDTDQLTGLSSRLAPKFRYLPLRVPRRPLAQFGILLILLLAVVSLFPHVIAPYDPFQIELSERLLAPQSTHWFGTDDLGRDVFSQIVYGARIALVTGVFVLTSAALIGSAAGLLSGYVGGVADHMLTDITDMFASFPVLLLAAAIIMALQPGLFNTTIVLAFMWSPRFARLMRDTAVSVMERPYVEAAISYGASPWRVMSRHILPNSLTPLFVQITIDMGYIVLTVAGLGFLGLGAQPPVPEWGVMISNGRAYYLEAAWVVVFPGLAIATTVLAFQLVGEDLSRDLLEPHNQ